MTTPGATARRPSLGRVRAALLLQVEQRGHAWARLDVGGRAVVLAWPGERIVVWADTRTPYDPHEHLRMPKR